MYYCLIFIILIALLLFSTNETFESYAPFPFNNMVDPEYRQLGGFGMSRANMLDSYCGCD